jgi:tetratricopeptide (TPR) repeat protein
MTQKNESKKKIAIKGFGAFIIISAVICFIIARVNSPEPERKKMEKTLNAGIEYCRDGNYADGLPLINSIIEQSHRKRVTSTEKMAKDKFKVIESDALFWKGVILLKQLQQKYAEERRSAVTNQKTFKLPADELTPIETVIKQSLKLNEVRPEAYRILGYLYREKKHLPAAVEMFEKAVELKEDFAEAFNDLGESYYLLKKYEKARENFEKAIIANKNLSSPYLNLGMYYFHNLRSEAAGKNSQKAQKYLKSFIKMSEQSEHQEDVVRAREMLSKIVKGERPAIK